ncbi:MAG: hypothetical protein RL693_2896 [Verrucomicrobiota bacterium]|jgi:chromosome segregation ATPase
MIKAELLSIKPSMAKLMAAILCFMVLPSCQEHKRLDAEIKKTRQEADSLRIQLNTANEEYEMCAKSLNLLKSQQSKISGTSSFEEKARKLEVELNALNDRKTLLEKTVQVLQQDMEEYKKFSA